MAYIRLIMRVLLFNTAWDRALTAGESSGSRPRRASAYSAFDFDFLCLVIASIDFFSSSPNSGLVQGMTRGWVGVAMWRRGICFLFLFFFPLRLSLFFYYLRCIISSLHFFLLSFGPRRPRFLVQWM
jgi:hypothetical protein